jgi:hypothetical protein
MWRPLALLLACTLFGAPLQASGGSLDPVEPDAASRPADATPADVNALGLKIYFDEFGPADFGRVTYGFDRDAVCTAGTCDDASPCLNHATCTGIGSGLCNFTPCTNDFTGLCRDDTTVCQTNSDCTGIGDGICVTCAPPNQMCGVKVESLTPGAPLDQTIWELVCDPATPPDGTDCQVGWPLPADTVSWDFSGFNPTNLPDLIGTASTAAPITASQTPNHAQCGFNPSPGYPSRQLQREDKNYADPPNVVSTLNSVERVKDVGVCDDGSHCAGDPDCTGIGDGTCKFSATVWLRGVVRFEGIQSDILGLGESRLCHADDDGTDRTDIPLFRFPNQDSHGYYMELGDPRWLHVPYDCEPIILFPAAVSADPSTGFEARQTGQVVNEGVVKLPSGHQFKSLVTRGVTEYGVDILACLIETDKVRTVIYLWEVSHLGTVVRLQSDKLAADPFSITHISEIDMKYGLYPPLSVTVDAVTDTSVDLSWDPGLITDHISGYRIYWDTESGGQCSTGLEDCTADHPGAGDCAAGETCCGTPGDTCDSYDFDSVSDPGQVSFTAATAATVGGLDPSTTYYFTVTAMSDFTNPATLVTTSYESALYPTQIPAVPHDLPVEVGATTTGGGAPAGAVPDGDDRPGTQLTLAKGTGGTIDLAWGASCLPGDNDHGIYEGLLGSFGSHVPVTCFAGASTSASVTPGAGNRYYVVVPANASFEGSYGLDSSGTERAVSAAPCLPQSTGDPVCP